MEGFFTAFTCLETKREKIGSFNVAHPSLSFILDVIIHENGMHLSRNSTTTYLALRLIATLMRFPMGLCTHHQRKSSEKFEKIDYVICISNRAWKKPHGNRKHFHYIFDIKEKDTQLSFLLYWLFAFTFPNYFWVQKYWTIDKEIRKSWKSILCKKKISFEIFQFQFLFCKIYNCANMPSDL